MTTSPEAPNTSKTPMARRLLKKVPPQIRIIFVVLGLLLIFGLFSLGMQLFMLLVVVMSEVPWVASGILLGIFLILLLPSKGWTVFGTLLFIVGAIVSAIADVPGNPIYNAPFEALFLNEGEYLSASVIIEHPTQGETAVTRDNIIVDAEGNELRDINDFLTFLYRLVLYSVIYGVLITLRGFLAKMKTTSTSASPRKKGNDEAHLKTP